MASKKAKQQKQPPRQHKEPFSAFAFIQDQSTLNFVRPLRNGDFDARGKEKSMNIKADKPERASESAAIAKLPVEIIALINKLEKLEDRAFEERQHWRAKSAGLAARYKDKQSQYEDVELTNERLGERGVLLDEDIKRANEQCQQLQDELQARMDDNKHQTSEISRLEFELQGKRQEAKDAQVALVRALWHREDRPEPTEFHFLHTRRGSNNDIADPVRRPRVDEPQAFARRYACFADGGLKDGDERELRAAPPVLMETVGHQGSLMGGGSVGRQDSVSLLSAGSPLRRSYSSGIVRPQSGVPSKSRGLSQKSAARPKSASLVSQRRPQ